jgi:hypothetical protein
MKATSTATFFILTATLAGFVGGYWLGTHKTLKHLDASGEFSPKKTPSVDIDVEKITRKSNKTVASPTNMGQAQNVIVDDGGTPVMENTGKEELFLAQNASVIDTLAFLNALEQSDEVEVYKKMGSALEVLRNAVKGNAAKDNAENFQILVDYFADSGTESQVPYYITGVLHSADIVDKELLMNNLVTRLSAQGTAIGNTKLLHLVSSRGMHVDNDEIVSTIKNIALYSPADSTNKTFALDLLIPFQLTSNEKNKVVTDLSFALHQAPREEVSFIVENIIRFSDKSERVTLASSYLSENNNFETRVAILSTMHSGSVKPNDVLKAALFRIAENQSDPLSKHARDTLMNVFEIDNDEYTRLRQGG